MKLKKSARFSGLICFSFSDRTFPTGLEMTRSTCVRQAPEPIMIHQDHVKTG